MNEQFDPWAKGVNNIASALMQMPMMRAQMRDQAARNEYYQANATESLARARHSDAQAAESNAKQVLLRDLQTAAPKGLGDIMAGNVNSPDAQNLIGVAAATSGQSPSSVVESILGLARLQQAGMATNDPTARFANLTGKGLPEGYSLNEQQRLQNNPLILNQGQTAFQPTPPIGPEAMVPVGVPLQSGFQQVAQGMPGRQWYSATPGSAILNNAGDVMHTVPSTANPNALNPATRQKIQSIGQALAEVLKREKPTAEETAWAEELMQRLDRLGGLSDQASTPEPAPPVAERVVGRQYSTPKGVFTWTGQGWTDPDTSPGGGNPGVSIRMVRDPQTGKLVPQSPARFRFDAKTGELIRLQ